MIGHELRRLIEDSDYGRPTLLEVIAPPNRSGLLFFGWISLALDPHVYTYQTREYVSHLFTVEGMR